MIPSSNAAAAVAASGAVNENRSGATAPCAGRKKASYTIRGRNMARLEEPTDDEHRDKQTVPGVERAQPQVPLADEAGQQRRPGQSRRGDGETRSS